MEKANKIGRNDSCPCGSNLKYKNCCLALKGRFAATTVAAALQFFQAGQFPRAEATCEKVLEQEPNNPDALHLLGMISQHSGNLIRAAEMMDRSIQASPWQPVYYCNLGNVYREQNRDDEAIACYRNAIALDAENVESLNNLGLTLQQQGKSDEAVACYRKAIGLNPGYAVAHFNLGDALKKMGSEEEAMASYQRSLEIDPSLAELLKNAGTETAPPFQVSASNSDPTEARHPPLEAL
jgi:tetratricopeptide (TPR) repeat protein